MSTVKIERYIIIFFIFKLGEKYSGIKPRGELQVYDQLKKYHLDQGTLFEDPQFVPGSTDLGVNLGDVKWLRPQVRIFFTIS